MRLIETLEYEPVPLEFGTSGLRALIMHMTDLECYINVSGFLQFLEHHDSLKKESKIYIAGDLRESTPRIMQVVFAACHDKGLSPVNCGKLPTPAAAYYALYQDAPCIVVTGSHIPSDRNGIKFYKRAGEVLKDDEVFIKSEVAQVRSELYEQELENSIFDTSGALKQREDLPDILVAAETSYEERYTKTFDNNCLAGKKIVVYQHSAVGRDLMVRIFQALGAHVTAVERSDTFLPIDTENVTKEDKERFLKFAAEYPDSFAIVSTDGDSDRPFVIDETGVFHRGDILGGVVADFLGARFAAIPISSNDATDVYCADKGIKIVHTKIGSPYVIAAMQEAPPENRPAVSWEVNGGFLSGDDVYVNGQVLKPLPTRDALLPIICALLAATKNGQKVSELFAALPQRFTAGGLIDDISKAKIEQFKADCKDQKKISGIMAKAFADTDLGNPTKLDLTDGLRLIFESGDIIHLRPSGNAPQFRVYTNASTLQRADELAEEAVRKNGYIEKLLEVI